MSIKSKVPYVVILFLLFRQRGRGKEPDPSSLAKLKDKKEITIRNLPSPGSRDTYIKTIVRKVNKATDYSNPTVKAFAAQLAGQYEGKYNLSQVAAMHQHLYNNFKYVNDPNTLDYFERASEVVASNLSSDCDGFATLIYSLVTAIGGRARWNVAWSSEGGHAFSEVYLADTKIKADRIIDDMLKKWRMNWKNVFNTFWNYMTDNNYELNYTADETGVWLNLDYSSAFPGGPYFQSDLRVAIFPKEEEYKIIKGQL